MHDSGSAALASSAELWPMPQTQGDLANDAEDGEKVAGNDREWLQVKALGIIVLGQDDGVCAGGRG